MMESSMNDPGLSLEEKLQTLQERVKEISSFVTSLSTLKSKLEKKKQTIKEIIEKKIQDNERELQKWKELLFIIVNESLDEKIEKLNTQEKFFNTTRDEIEKAIETCAKNPATADDDTDDEGEDPKLDDLLDIDLKLKPEGLTTTETTEMESNVKKDFNVLLNEPKKSLRRTFAYVSGIIRGYLRRGKSNINWITIMRKLEGREFEERMINELDPYIGSKLQIEEDIVPVPENVSNTWNSICNLFENRHNKELRTEFCDQLYKYYDRNPEDVMFYLPQLCNLLLNQENQFQPLKQFFLDKCKQSVHFALQAYLLVRASKDSREHPKKKKVIPQSIIQWRILCNSLLSEVRKAISVPMMPSQPAATSETGEMTPGTTDQIFQYPIKFMDSIVEIANVLTNSQPDQYRSELDKQLEILDKDLQAAPPGAFVYIPMLKPVGTAEYHRVIRIPQKEAYPIPTYGRVLFYFLIEVVDAQKEEDRESDRKKHKKKKKKEMRDSIDTAAKEPQSDVQDNELASEMEASNSLKSDDERSFQERFQSPEKEEKKAKKHHHRKKKDKLLFDSQEISGNSRGTTSTESLVSPSNAGGGPLGMNIVPSLSNNSISSSTGSPPNDRSQLVRSLFPSQPLGYHSAFGELWERKTKRIQKDSPFGNAPRWRMQALIVKYGEEVLQEEFAMQLIVQFQRIFLETNMPVKLCPYRILAISNKSGLIEPIPNSLSLDKLKKQHTNLLNFFIQTFGDTSETGFKQAQQNFVKTMSAYSVVCYLLQIKDRHNGNILLDASGHIVHIDFGYLLAKTIKFEQAPFKLTNEFVEVMGGYNSPVYKQYCRLCVKSYLAARKHYKKIMLLVEITMEGKGKKVMSCLQGGKVLEELLQRFHLDWTDEECEKFIHGLIEEARGSWRTIVYDAYQLILNNIH